MIRVYAEQSSILSEVIHKLLYGKRIKARLWETLSASQRHCVPLILIEAKHILVVSILTRISDINFDELTIRNVNSWRRLFLFFLTGTKIWSPLNDEIPICNFEFLKKKANLGVPLFILSCPLYVIRKVIP